MTRASSGWRRVFGIADQGLVALLLPVAAGVLASQNGSFLEAALAQNRQFWRLVRVRALAGQNGDSVLARPLKMSRFDPTEPGEPGPVPKCKNGDSIQGGPFKMNRFGPRTTTRTTTATTRTNDTAPPRRRPGQQSPRHGAAQTTPLVSHFWALVRVRAL